VLPLRVSGQKLGAMTLVWADDRRSYGAEEVELAEELGRRAALAIDNARLYREARQAIQQRDEFLSVASHELNTPLTALTLGVHALRSALGEKVDAQLGPMLDLTERQCRRLRRLIQDLFDVARLERGPLPLSLTDVDLNALVREAAAGFALTRSGSTLSIVTPGPLRGRWDSLRLEQVVLNLLSNAVKFGAGKPIELRLERAGDRAILSVIDAGIGIDPAVQDRIFGRFARAVSSEYYGGMGLGLYISRQLVQQQGGTLTVSSTPGQGSTFVVSLPCVGRE
jgi:signal transduction histidine kinase